MWDSIFTSHGFSTLDPGIPSWSYTLIWPLISYVTLGILVNFSVSIFLLCAWHLISIHKQLVISTLNCLSNWFAKSYSSSGASATKWNISTLLKKQKHFKPTWNLTIEFLLCYNAVPLWLSLQHERTVMFEGFFPLNLYTCLGTYRDCRT